ncbi:MAG: metallophosphoesterase family protein [Anaerolineae bacterium]
MKRLRVLSWLTIVIVITLSACAPAGPKFQYESDSALRSLTEQTIPVFPAVDFVIFSDPHIYDPSLGTEGSAFEAYLASDRKLLRESPAILNVALSDVVREAPDFVLIPGDLTKDGEASSHALMVSYLQQLQAAGTKAFVVPGNHDVMNGLSSRYVGDQTERVPNVTTDEFAQLYADFGYSQALQRDANSLSYLAEPAPGLWLLALDSTRSSENQEDHEATVGGRFVPATLKWIEDNLAEAARQNKAVIVMMHHGVVPHFSTQPKDFSDYLVEDYAAVSRLFAAYNVRMVFSGHFHAQDIALAAGPANKALYDIQTGSMATYPNTYRLVTISADQQASISSRQIAAIPSHPTDFLAYSRAELLKGIGQITVKTMEGYKVGKAEAESLAPQVAAAFLAHYSGDESLPAGQEIIRTKGLTLIGWVVVTYRKGLLVSLWDDAAPADNTLTINLTTGKAQ